MPHGVFVALWLALVRFVASLFARPPSPAPLPVPVTARTKPNAPTRASVRVADQRWVKRPSPLKRASSAVASPISSSARTSPACRSRSPSPSDPQFIFHPPPSPFPTISLSGIFATPPSLASNVPLPSPPSSRRSHGLPSPSLHTLHSRSPRTPRTPSSAVIVHLDRSALSPTTMSDGSLEVISLGDPPVFLGSPINLPDIARLPSPWSPVAKKLPSDVWMSVDGMLVNAAGPVMDDLAPSLDDSVAHRFSVSRISTTSLYSSSSALGAFGISVFVDLDEVGKQGDDVDTKDDPSTPNQVCDENRPTLVTPRKRRDTLPSVTSHTASHSSRSAKYFSTPLTKLDNVGVSHVRSATSISSMAYELRMGLIADGRSITAFENFISLLDQASPDSTRTTPHHDAIQPLVAS